jgi:hypothetical protein
MILIITYVLIKGREEGTNEEIITGYYLFQFYGELNISRSRVIGRDNSGKLSIAAMYRSKLILLSVSTFPQTPLTRRTLYKWL